MDLLVAWNTMLFRRWVLFTPHMVRSNSRRVFISYYKSHVKSISGLGLLMAPFISTQFAQLPRWSFYYLISLGLSLSNLTLQLAVFRFRSLNGISHLFSGHQFLTWLSECLGQGGEPSVVSAPENLKGGLFSQVMHSWPTHMIALFIALHLGVTVTLSGMA